MSQQYYFQLKAVLEFLTDLQDEAWQSLEKLFMLKPFKKGEYFAKAGEYPREMGFVVSGIFRAFYRNENGIEYNKTFFLSNTFMSPFASLIFDTQNHINLQALADSEMLVADYKKLTRLYDQYTSLERFARKAIEIEWCKKEQRELRLVLNSAEERYDSFLEEHPGLENQIPQYHIASYLGITPVALSRIRAKRRKK